MARWLYGLLALWAANLGVFEKLASGSDKEATNALVPDRVGTAAARMDDSRRRLLLHVKLVFSGAKGRHQRPLLPHEATQDGVGYLAVKFSGAG
jgi:hypothetical protein